MSTLTISPWVGKGTSTFTVADRVGLAADFGSVYQNFALSPDTTRVHTLDSGFFRMVNVATRNLTTIAGNSTQNIQDGIELAACVGGGGGVLAVDPNHT